MIARLILALVFSLPGLCAIAAAADQSRPIHLDQALFGPEIVMHHAEELGLDDSQRQAIQEEFAKSRQKFGAMQMALEREVVVFTQMLQQPAVDETAALAQLDKVLEGERQIKRARLSLSLSIRGKLNASQQSRVREIMEKMSAPDRTRERTAATAPPAMQERLEKLQELVRRARDTGRDASAVQPIMQQLSALIREGKFQEAEPLIERAFKMLDDNQK